MTPEEIFALHIARKPGIYVYELEWKVFMLEEIVRLLCEGLIDDAGKALATLQHNPTGKIP